MFSHSCNLKNKKEKKKTNRTHVVLEAVSVPGTQLEGSGWTFCSREEERVESRSLILKCGSSLFHAYFCALGK